MSKKSFFIIGIVVLAAAAAACFVLLTGGGDEATDNHAPMLRQKGAHTSSVKTPEGLAKSKARRDAIHAVTNASGKVFSRVPGSLVRRPEDNVFRDENGKPYPAGDQKLMQLALDVIENDDVEGAADLAAKALESGNKELRAMTVDALSWFGKDALVELTQYMSDKDEEVAEAAQSGWVSALQEVDDDGMKAGIVELTLNRLSSGDVVDEIANELIGIDELAAVQVLANVISDDKNPNAVAAAKETYNSITGEDWSDLDSAEAWLQENYTPPEE